MGILIFIGAVIGGYFTVSCSEELIDKGQAKECVQVWKKFDNKQEKRSR